MLAGGVCCRAHLPEPHPGLDLRVRHGVHAPDLARIAVTNPHHLLAATTALPVNCRLKNLEVNEFFENPGGKLLAPKFRTEKWRWNDQNVRLAGDVRTRKKSVRAMPRLRVHDPAPTCAADMQFLRRSGHPPNFPLCYQMTNIDSVTLLN